MESAKTSSSERRVRSSVSLLLVLEFVYSIATGTEDHILIRWMVRTSWLMVSS